MASRKTLCRKPYRGYIIVTAVIEVRGVTVGEWMVTTLEGQIMASDSSVDFSDRDLIFNAKSLIDDVIAGRVSPHSSLNTSATYEPKKLTRKN